MDSVASALGWTIIYGSSLFVAAIAFNTVWSAITRKPLSFDKRHVFITGGTKGLGRSYAILMAKEGANVTVLARGKEALQSTVSDLEGARKNSSQKMLGLSVDVTDQDSLIKAVEEATRVSGEIDWAVICAGSAHPGFFADTSSQTFCNQMTQNYLGAVYTLKAAVPSMIKRKSGNIVIVSSAMALTAYCGYSQYAPTKWALRCLGDSLRSELVVHGINVTQFYPSNMDTPGYKIENETKPPPTREIEGTAALISPDKSAEDLLNGIRAGKYHITQEFLVELLRIGSSGCTPRNHPVLETIILSLYGIIGAIVYRFAYDLPVFNFAKKQK
eukprot:TRINITY_DN19176_c0_g1_i1.p1 TRINITY_DN19176_c0_g1~~TRINITY_DN19176_c0_g1_i1.p1  ORF type:complete len:330 (+),score=65.08 TRINITY_DN19176_c0_g1_i1:44-1033(+)